ncbi:TldD/PmbA family protein [Crocosphaera sp. XPORK-15E]|uniref:TldD/PmbA family protein n=1 Tax=Crocosphaera sp. XPORK-15E TaxID=3110247 RepID=UPI002B203B7F|nr:TldD/PmbA family protein [Crocosphaera sp. XPORK-15E]MEA5532941.1 TldD/PmbA family protein [Crocosphaera sp. XPORK-15E]
MNPQKLEHLESSFKQLCDHLINILNTDEHLSIELSSEQTQFIRFNGAKVRQTGMVKDGTIKLTLIANQRTAYAAFPFTVDVTTDSKIGRENLDYLRKELPQLPEDPHIVLPENCGSSREVYPGILLSPEKVVNEILHPVSQIDMTGIYTAGQVIRGNANSAGQFHWFATESFILDYSLITPSEKAVKGTFSGQNWEQQQYLEQIKTSKTQLLALETPSKTLKPGGYRTYFAPAAVADLVSMLSWGGISEASLRRGGSALLKLQQGNTLSPLFSLQENFSKGTVPRFNELGEIAPEILPIITEGKLVNTLINARTASEYKLTPNGANSFEGLRSPELARGNLGKDEILSTLKTGLYVSNLHYLNWSDRTGGRITGMTRYACFWVDNGEIIAPIENLRFDESLYRFWGENLVNLTDFREFIPETNTYSKRSLGGVLVPGMLVNDFQFTL